jgi:hypothetical protein
MYGNLNLFSLPAHGIRAQKPMGFSFCQLELKKVALSAKSRRDNVCR